MGVRECPYCSRGEKRLSTNRKSLYRGKVVDLGIESLVLPDGRQIELEVVRHPGGAAVAAVDDEGRVCLVRQFRHAAGGWIWEVPAGKLDPGEGPLATAQRELEEEAGLRAACWTALGSILSTPGFCDEVIHLFLAQQLENVPRRLGDAELIEVHWMSLEEAGARLASGEVRDAKTVVALYRVREALIG